MIFGMVPLAFALSEGSEQRAPMGQAVIGGVITSSLLTLVVVPVVYCYLDDLAQWAARKWQRDRKELAARSSGGGAQAVPASKIDDLS
jgi:HAE1 family hydrophobic/amphiphilic exporter-1